MSFNTDKNIWEKYSKLFAAQCSRTTNWEGEIIAIQDIHWLKSLPNGQAGVARGDNKMCCIIQRNLEKKEHNFTTA